MADISVRKSNEGQSPAPVVRRDWEPFRLMRDMLRWDPFREMTPVFTSEVSSYAPAFEIKETSESFVFKADLPGVKDQDLEVTTTGARLTISGKREAEYEKETKENNYYAYERSYGSFTRTFTLPEQADLAHIRAELRNGELTVVVPKTAAAVPRKIPVAGEKPKT